MKLVDARLVVTDVMLDRAIQLFDVKTLRRVGSYGGKGDGPGEFTGPGYVVARKAASPVEVWILDGIQQRLTLLSLDEIEGGTVDSPVTSRLEGPKAHSLVRAREGSWFAGGWITDGRVGRYNEDWSYDRTIVGFPPEAGEASGTTLQQAYESRVVADPAHDRLAAATHFGGLLDIFDNEGGLLAQAAVPDRFQPAWAQGRSRSGRAVMSAGDETRYGFIDLEATERHLYGLFSGIRVDDDAWATPEVQVYTWEGEHVMSVYLDRAAETIAIDPSDTWLYATGPDPSPWLARYRLPEP